MVKNTNDRGSMNNILLKYNFIEIIPFEDTFFYTSTLPKNIKFTQDLLKLNYSKYSPIKNPNISSRFINNQLMLWFYNKTVKSSIVIPQSYILFHELKKQNKDAIYILHDDKYKILVIKDSKLLSSLILDNLDETILKLSADEYQVSNKIMIEKDELNKLYLNSLNNLSLSEIYHWNKFSLDTKSISKELVSKVSYPLSVLVIFAILVNYTHNNNLNKNIEVLKENYLIEKNKNNDLREDIKQHNKDVQRWNEFISKELIYPDSISLLNSIYKILEKPEKTFINRVSINNGRIVLVLKTNLSSVLLLNRLSDMPYFSNVSIVHSHNDKNNFKNITYNFNIRILKDK